MPDGGTVDVPLARERTTIGRRADNDICLPDLAVSGDHAVVVTILADSFLEDLGSTNGTQVNGKAIAKHFLRDRDQVEIGRHKLIYCADDDAVIEGEIIRTLAARAAARNLGEVVDSARPFVRAKRERRPAADVANPAPDPPRVEAGAQPLPVAADSAAELPAAPMVAPQALPSAVAAVKVLTGINAGTSLQLTKAETTIGRPGLQVAAIVRTGDRFLLKPIEGAAAPEVNGRPAGRDGVDLVPGDLIEIAGTQVEFVGATSGPKEPT